MQSVGPRSPTEAHVAFKSSKHCVKSFLHEPSNVCFLDGHHGLISATIRLGARENKTQQSNKTAPNFISLFFSLLLLIVYIVVTCNFLLPFSKSALICYVYIINIYAEAI